MKMDSLDGLISIDSGHNAHMHNWCTHRNQVSLNSEGDDIQIGA